MYLFRKYRIYFVFSLLFIGFSSFLPPESDWELKKNENGILVYTRNLDNTSFKELKATANVKTSLNSIVALLYDWDNYPNWVYRCGKSSTIKIVNDNELVHYQTVLAPWPVDNRDFCITIHKSQDKTTKVVTIRSTSNPDVIPSFTNYVRIRKFNASWILVPKKDGTVDITYQLLVDPGGSVPAWLVNMAAMEGPFDTMVNIRSWSQKEKYQKAKIPSIEELK